MRSAIAVAALAAGALAVPYAENKRGLVEYEVDIKYVTNIVTITVDGTAPTEAPKPVYYEPPKPVHYEAPKPVHYGHKSVTTYAPAPSPYEAPVAYNPPAAYSPPAASSPSSGSSGEAPTDYKSAVLYSHNLHRANHSVLDVAWDNELEECALEVARSCRYAHDTTAGGGGYGQNIAAGVDSSNITAIITDMFYNGEEPLYASYYGREPDMTNFELWGHFTQLVWKGTTHVACVTYDCSATGLANTGGGVSPHFTVCNYKGPGNYAGEYSANVLAPKGQPTVDWSASAY